MLDSVVRLNFRCKEEALFKLLSMKERLGPHVKKLYFMNISYFLIRCQIIVWSYELQATSVKFDNNCDAIFILKVN